MSASDWNLRLSLDKLKPLRSEPLLRRRVAVVYVLRVETVLLSLLQEQVDMEG